MSYIEDIKAFADKQFEKYHDSEAIGFIYKGTCVIDPWMDQTGRFSFSTQKAFETYGAKNMLGFIEEASLAAGLNDVSFPIPGHLLADLKDETVNDINLWKNGRNDYSVYFKKYDSSVRGTVGDITEDLKEIFPGKEA